MAWVKRCCKKIILEYFQPLKHQAQRPYYVLKRKIYAPYDSAEFKTSLLKSGIRAGDSIFVMCSADNVYARTGRHLPVHLVLDDLLEVIGKEGTLMVLGFSDKRAEIIEGKRIFDVRRTLTDCGLLAELLRRKPATVRSLQPIFSALAYGKKAREYCASHHLSPYPFDENSPFYRLMQNGGKYLGIGVGVEAFTPGHMIDDYFKACYKHSMYFKVPKLFEAVGYHGEKITLSSFVRSDRGPLLAAPRYHFKLLKVASRKNVTRSGISLFTMDIKSYFQAGVDLYERKKITIWDTGLPVWMQKTAFFKERLKKILQ